MERADDELRKKKDKLTKMLEVQDTLQARKVELLQETSKILQKKTEEIGDNTVATKSSNDSETKHLYSQLLPILQDIYREELKILEQKERLELSSIHSEKTRLQGNLKQFCQTISLPQQYTSQLGRWSKELKCLDKEKDALCDGCEVVEVSYSVQDNLPGNVVERLSFTTCYTGVCVYTSLNMTAANNNSSVLPSPPNLSATSDIFIPDLEHKVREAHSSREPIKNVVTFIVEYINSEILPLL